MTNTPAAPTDTDKILIVLSHLSYFYFPLLFPLIIYLVKKDESPLVAAQAKEALNFHIAWTVYVVLSALLILALIGIVLLPIVGVAGLVLAIVAAVKGAEGKAYRYPLIFRLV